MKGSLRFPKLHNHPDRSGVGMQKTEYFGPQSTPFGSRTATFLCEPKVPAPTPRPITVYDSIPPGLGGQQQYTAWRQEWLPRLAGSRASSKRRPTKVSRNPIGFAIRVNPAQSDINPVSLINPTVLSFSGSTIRYREGGIGPRSAKRTEELPHKTLRRVYSTSPFRREGTNIVPEPPRPSSSRMGRMASDPTSASAPHNYYFPDVTKELATTFMPECRLENYMEPEKKKYFVISQTLKTRSVSPSQRSSSGTPKRVRSPVEPFYHSHNRDERADDELVQFGVKPDHYHLTTFSVGRGTLLRGHAWKMMENLPEPQEEEPFLQITNRGDPSNTGTEQKVKVKDVLAIRIPTPVCEPVSEDEDEDGEECKPPTFDTELKHLANISDYEPK